jgi:hypothetical protein
MLLSVVIVVWREKEAVKCRAAIGPQVGLIAESGGVSMKSLDLIEDQVDAIFKSGLF